MRAKEADFAKQQALYEQEIYILKQQLKDAEERSENQELMHRKMFKALEEQTGEPHNIQLSLTSPLSPKLD
jgi:hypothetical protein